MKLHPRFPLSSRAHWFPLVLAVVTCACGNDQVHGPNTNGQLPIGVTWKLACLGGAGSETCYKLEPDGPYTIRFATDGTVVGTNACNTCTGTYSRSGASMRVHWTCTETACGDPPRWQGYDDAIARVSSFVLTPDDALVLRYVDAGGVPLELWHHPAP